MLICFMNVTILFYKLYRQLQIIHIHCLSYIGIIMYPILFFLCFPIMRKLHILNIIIAFISSTYLLQNIQAHVKLYIFCNNCYMKLLAYSSHFKYLPSVILLSILCGYILIRFWYEYQKEHSRERKIPYKTIILFAIQLLLFIKTNSTKIIYSVNVYTSLVQLFAIECLAMSIYYIYKAYHIAFIAQYVQFKKTTYTAIFHYIICKLRSLISLIFIWTVPFIRIYHWYTYSKPVMKTQKRESSILPPLTLLDTPKHKHIKWDHKQRLDLLEKVLQDYNIKGKILSYNIGPVVTLYKLEPEPGIKASTIIGLSSDIARSMSALSVRIATIPGYNLLGIEIANPARQTVFLRELLETDDYQSATGIALALGCDIAGKPFIVNLETMPHMLIAGTTGSGKSVCIHTLLLSIVYKHTPDTCKLIMIDPKMLELSIYKDLPHLILPVITNPKLAITALKWAITEMERRYENMATVGARNISEYNANNPEKLPYIVVIVDEFADLMMVAGKEIDDAIQRLAQMARAAGIHVILATQRPSVDVITGTIKANFPTRLSFQLASRIDSRTILGDRGGADQLLGKGDMLYLSLSNLIRAHGPYVSNDEVEAVVKHWKKQAKPNYQELKQTDDILEETAEGDEMFGKVMDYVYRTKKATASSIQREFSIGFNRAAKYLDMMEKMGKISPPDSMGRRKLL